ncbi:hypothetical protein DSAG12_03252 [Promethearchaeum syntrophicum]|uniref:Uncharacterized protein n=1 Tax=Promethearchaeum syntrophicum TaxID=2594042 RepID=A0A5B9DEG3_9ARCH|nr:hypothetical protein [Candidatus Prometheoarchaeum syntrophicum]QEE17415.1 DnaJ central domain protein [Candidatus Prometheoarchaeum syntrophicum]
MGNISIKSANPDVIWEKWKQKNAKKQNLEKYYGVKGAVFKLENITAAEYVKGVEKATVIYLEKSIDIEPSREKVKTEKASVRDIEKEKFYNIDGYPIKSEWKASTEVPFYNTLQKQNCSRCDGRGGMKCKKCDGSRFIPCPDCGGNSDRTNCKECKGTGKKTIEITILNEKEEKTKKTIDVKCNECIGSGKIPCSRCGGTGKVLCRYCEGFGIIPCSDCKGYGIFFNYQIKPVPFKKEHQSEPVILSSIKLSGLEREMGKEIHDAIEQVEAIVIHKPEKELEQKFIEPSLGYYSREIKNSVKEAAKEWKLASKNDDTNIRLPIYVFPVLVLNCETKKGKRFQVFSLGSDKKFLVFGNI